MFKKKVEMERDHPRSALLANVVVKLLPLWGHPDQGLSQRSPPWEGQASGGGVKNTLEDGSWLTPLPLSTPSGISTKKWRSMGGLGAG